MKPLAPQTFIEISLHAGTEGKLSKKRMAAFLAACGIPEREIVFFESPENFRAAVYTRQNAVLNVILSEAKNLASSQILRRKTPQDDMATLRITHRVLTRKDWLDKWQADYRMMPLGRKFMLVPFWQKKEFRESGRLPIYLDPKAAFGSGQHPSTQIMIELLEFVMSSPHGFRRGPACWQAKAFGDDSAVLDLGTGTGILSVAAHRLGAKKIRAYDLDGVAFQAARFNLKLNGAKAFSVRRENVTRLKSSERFDLVLANLTPAILTKAGRFIFSSVKKGGFLIVSGILSREIDDFHGCFTHAHYKCLKLVKKGGWGGLLLKRE